MKKRVLIVEDDKYFRFAVKKVIDWDRYGFELIGEAVHGAAALEFLETHSADLVITDMSMPVMNGIELTAALKERYPDILVIALSAYDDFEFVKESLKLGAQDYILKQDIETEDVGEAILRSWNKHLEHLAKDSQMLDRILKVLSGEGEDERAERYLELSMDSQWGCYLCKIKNLNPDWESAPCKKSVWLDMSLLELHEKTEHVLLLPVARNHSLKSQMEDRDQVLRNLEKLLEQESYLAGCSKKTVDPGLLKEMNQEAEQAIELGRFSKKKRVILWDYVKEQYEDRNREFLEDRELYANIYTLEQAKEALDRLTRRLCEQMPSEENIQRNYLLLVNTVAQNVNFEIGKYEFASAKEELSLCRLIEQKQEACHRFLERIFNNAGTKTMHASVLSSIQYMRQNYGRDISLGELANLVALNESYFSGLFKKDTGKSITAYLNEIRIEKAKELIAGTNLKNYEIAEQVGISNPPYFNTIFKKQTGLTIQEYRQRIQKN
ncbi:MAG TPA: response regulator [Clostridiales bacterium]|nr:response regulator [Clostridiales bacterium]